MHSIYKTPNYNGITKFLSSKVTPSMLGCINLNETWTFAIAVSEREAMTQGNLVISNST